MTQTFKTFFNTHFHIITGFVLLIAALFFTLGELMGAVSLRERYTSIGIGFGISCLFWLVLAFKHERLSGFWILTYSLAIISIVSIGIFIAGTTKINFPLVIIGIFTAIATGAIIIPPYVIAIVIIGTSITQIILSYGKKQNLLKKLLQAACSSTAPVILLATQCCHPITKLKFSIEGLTITNSIFCISGTVGYLIPII
jgi:hypothetical protein